MRIRNASPALVCGLVALLLPISLRSAEAEVRFNDQIRPILAEHCLACHGPDEQHREADLRLDLADSATRSAIVPHQPQDSELLLRITTDDPDLRMPPPDAGEQLSAEQVALVRQWIAEGAQYEGHWAYEPIRRPEIPVVSDTTLGDIDRFIVARLQQRGLSMAPGVSRQQLIRRATFDLTGLPPTWEEVEAFVNDSSPQAYEKVLDRLLESPRYGERWGRHWLDIARYADTHGGSAIGFTKFPFSYTYRDYVVRALNADTPYDRFITEQLAADQLGLPDNDPALAGVGFLTVGMQYRNPHDVIDDQIDVVTRGLLGLTVACARCHDHKYDAIPTTDYYALYATLASSESPRLLPAIGQPPDTPQYQAYSDELARRQQRLDDMAREQTEVMRSRLRMQVGLYLRELAKGTPEQDLSSAFLSFRTDDVRPHVLNRWRKYLADIGDQDPVFGPWHQLARLEADGFAQRAVERLEALKQENGDPASWSPAHTLAANPPRWNPRVLDALIAKAPQSMLDVADAYGQLFAEVHQQWLRVLIDTSLEARPGAELVPDEDPRHADVNSPVNRELRRHLYEPDTPTAMSQELAERLLNRPIHDHVRGLHGAIHELHLNSPGSPPRAMALEEKADPGEFHVFRRGSSIDRGEPVEARFLTVLSSDTAASFPPGKRRLGLAQAIVHPDNPLTRRVVVNWAWQHHFGQGLVRTPDDFGTRGRPPTHPQLLDYLAEKFAEDGWSLKRLHRRIMLSAVYQQAASENPAARMADPDNELLWRMPRRKLDLEAMRDAMLFVSGELDLTLGGRPFDFLSSPVVPRRSIYGFVNRDIVSSLASTFDGANPSSCTARRPETYVPQQTLFALNSDFIQDRAVALAARPEIAGAADDAQRVQRLYQSAFSRAPEPDELQLALQYFQSAADDSPSGIWQRLAHVLLAANEFIFVD